MQRRNVAQRGCQVFRREFGCVSSCVAALSTLHDSAGLPWWAAIAGATISVRTMLLPATLVARGANAQLGKALPQLRNLNILLRDAIKRHSNDAQGSRRSVTLYMQAVHKTLQLHSANPLTAFFLMPAVHAPTFITFALAVRQLPTAVDDYHLGGALWFMDLAAADPFAILPLCAVSAAYFNLRPPNAATDTKLTLASVLRNSAQISLLVAFPLTLHLPAGFHIYWLSSSVFTALSSRAMRPITSSSVSSAPATKTGDSFSPSPPQPALKASK